MEVPRATASTAATITANGPASMTSSAIAAFVTQTSAASVPDAAGPALPLPFLSANSSLHASGFFRCSQDVRQFGRQFHDPICVRRQQRVGCERTQGLQWPALWRAWHLLRPYLLPPYIIVRFAFVSLHPMADTFSRLSPVCFCLFS